MAHITKFKKGSGSGLAREWNRTAKNYKNENIDPSKSHLNVITENWHTNFKNIKKKVTSETKLRANGNELVGIVVTLPKELLDTDTEYQKSILAECGKFIDKKVNENTKCDFNIGVGSQIHFDETTPHIHTQFVPLTHKTDKQGKEYIGYDYNDIFKRDFYRTLHKELEQHMKEKFPELQKYDELFVEKEVKKTKYVDENGNNVGNISHWELKKKNDKIVQKIIDGQTKLSELTENVRKMETREVELEGKLKELDTREANLNTRENNLEDEITEKVKKQVDEKLEIEKERLEEHNELFLSNLLDNPIYDNGLLVNELLFNASKLGLIDKELYISNGWVFDEFGSLSEEEIGDELKQVLNILISKQHQYERSM